MKDETPSQAAEKSTTPTPNHRYTLIASCLLVFLLVVATTGMYTWQHKKVDDLNRQVISLQRRVNTLSSTAVKQNQVRFIRTLGFPFDLKATTITTNLGVPVDIEAVQIRSTGNNPGSEEIFTDKFNDEMARYTLGYPQFPASGGSNEISILAISPSWLSTSNERETFWGYGDATGIEPQVDLQSPASKLKYVQGLSSLTKECVKDPTKGFQTKDKVFSICYAVVTDKYGGPSTLLLRGYAEVQGEPLILVGLMSLDDHNNILNPATAGIHLQTTNDATKELIYALSQTTIIAGSR